MTFDKEALVTQFKEMFKEGTKTGNILRSVLKEAGFKAVSDESIITDETFKGVGLPNALKSMRRRLKRINPNSFADLDYMIVAKAANIKDELKKLKKKGKIGDNLYDLLASELSTLFFWKRG